MLRNFFDDLKIWKKVLVAFVALAIPLLITTYYYSVSLVGQMVFSEKEIEGARVIIPLRHLLENTMKHRGNSLIYSNRQDPSVKSRLENLQSDIKEVFKSLEQVALENPYIPIDKQVSTLRNHWSTIKNNVFSNSAPQNLSQHNEYIDEILSVIVKVADVSNLTFDPDPDTYYFMTAVTLEIPKIVNNMGMLRGLGAGVLASKSMSTDQKLNLIVLERNTEELVEILYNQKSTIFDYNPELKVQFSDMYKNAIDVSETFFSSVKSKILEDNTYGASPTEFFDEVTVAMTGVFELNDEINLKLIELLENRVDRIKTEFYFDLTVSIVFVALALVLLVFVVKGITSRMSTAQAISGNIANGNLKNVFPKETQDEAGQMLKSLSDMQGLLYTQMEEIAKLASTIESVPTNIMMCNSEFEITYMNPAVTSLLRNRQAQIREVVAGFDVDKLIGVNIDIFHKNPAHQRAILSDDSKLPWTAEIKVSGVDFRLTAVSLKDNEGNRIGNTVLWEDITQDLDAQKQVGEIISDAVNGKLDNRLNTTAFSGVMKTIGNGVNELIDTVVEPIKQTTSVMQNLAKGNLTDEMSSEYSGDFKALAEAVNFSTSNIRNLVGEIIESASYVSSSAKEISQGNTDLSQRTEEQASSLEQTAASMEEFTGTITENATNSERANSLAGSAQALAEKGGEVVSTAVDAMQEIETSSRKISDIISVIDEIAFQTNLLALNASVEAARAGEQGRGFAVVASEVRNLAQRSADAAKEIKELIEESVGNVAEGKRLVDESGSTLKEIVASVGNVTKIISDIDNASSEQSSGIQQVNQAISQMDEMTQQNAALVEQAAASAESLEEQSASLLEMMKFFNTGNGEGLSKKVVSPSVNRSHTSHKRASTDNSLDVLDDDSDDWAEF